MITTSNIIDLLDAHTPQKKIAKIVGVTERTVQHIQHAKKLGRGTKRSPGSGGHHMKRSKVFLKTFKDKITKDPTISMRRHAKNLNLDPKTIRTAINLGLGLNSFFKQPQHLFTKTIKQKSLISAKKFSLSSISNKKIFTVDKFIKERMTAELHQQKMFLEQRIQLRFLFRETLGSDGSKMPPYFFKTDQKIRFHVYCTTF